MVVLFLLTKINSNDNIIYRTTKRLNGVATTNILTIISITGRDSPINVKN